MTRRIRLGKTGDSRTRARAKPPVLKEQERELRQRLSNNADFADYLLAKGYSSRTTQRYVTDARRMQKWAEQENVPITAMTYADLLHYVQSFGNRVTQRTKSVMVNSIKHYFNYLLALGHVADNPALQISVKGVHRKRLHHILSRGELDRLYQNYGTEEDQDSKTRQYKRRQLNGKRNKVIVGLLVYQGLNASELKRLEIKDLDLRKGKIYVAGSRRSNERALELESLQILDMMEYCMKTREEMLSLTSKQSDKLLVTCGGGHSIQNALQRLVRELKKQDTGIRNLQQIRASVITHWLKLYNLREVQYMAGHRFVSSTESYLINDLEGFLEDINKYHPIG